MKRVILAFIVSFSLLFMLWYVSSANSDTVTINGTVHVDKGIYTYRFDKVLTATRVDIYHQGLTTTFTTTGTTIDISGLIITSTEELTVTGYAETITMIESDNPDEPYIRFSSTELLIFNMTKYFNKLYLPTIQN